MREWCIEKNRLSLSDFVQPDVVDPHRTGGVDEARTYERRQQAVECRRCREFVSEAMPVSCSAWIFSNWIRLVYGANEEIRAALKFCRLHVLQLEKARKPVLGRWLQPHAPHSRDAAECVHARHTRRTVRGRQAQCRRRREEYVSVNANFPLSRIVEPPFKRLERSVLQEGLPGMLLAPLEFFRRYRCASLSDRI